MKQQMMLLQQKQKLVDLQTKDATAKKNENIKASKDKEVKEVKETIFENPTKEDIKQLVEPPKDLKEKKKD